MTKEQALALARARLALKNRQPTQAAPQQAPAPQYTSGPMEDPQMSMDALSVSEAGIESSPEARRAAVRNFLQGMSFGTADEAEAALRSAFGDQTYAENIDMIRQEMSQFAEQNPAQAATQEIVGAAMSPASLLKAPRYIEQLAPMARGAIKGGVGGGLYGFGSAEGGLGERLEEGAVGAGTGIFIGAPLEKAVSLLGNAPLNRQIQRQTKAPDLDRLKQIKDAAYDAVDQADFTLGPNDVQNALQRMSKIAADNEYITVDPRSPVESVRKLITSKLSQGMTLGQAERVRRRLFDFAKGDSNDARIVREMIGEFDAVVDDALEQGQSATLKIARDANRRYRNVEAIEDAFKAVEIKPGRRTEGYQKVAQRLLSNRNQMRYFSPQERQILEQLATGTASQRLLNRLGKFEFSAKGLAGAINIATLSQAPFLALLFVGTGGAKYLADRQAINTARKLIKEAGGVKAIQEASRNPNQGALTVGGVTADQIREAFLLGEEGEEE